LDVRDDVDPPAGAALAGVRFEGAPEPLVELAMSSTVRLDSGDSQERRGTVMFAER
jgi:hypothetical protein